MEFGIISEGVTDQIVLESILFGFFEDKNLPVNPLQPKPGVSGNWDKVFTYCESADFRQALTSEYSVDFVIIQIDTDFMRSQEVPERYRFNPTHLSVEEIADQMRLKLIDCIGESFYQQFHDRIFFAIAVDSIECWFLPIYFAGKPSIASKTTNCLDSLNVELSKSEGFYIKSKEEKYYRIISKRFQKRKDLLVFAEKNPSFAWFIKELRGKFE